MRYSFLTIVFLFVLEANASISKTFFIRTNVSEHFVHNGKSYYSIGANVLYSAILIVYLGIHI